MKTRIWSVSLTLMVMFSGMAIYGQDLDALADQYARKHFDTFRELLGIPNDAHYEDHVRRNVAWCDDAFSARGFATRTLATGGPPLLLATRETSTPGAATVLIYLQIDGQPVDPEYWFQEDPYRAELKQQAADGGWDIIPWQRIHAGYDPEWRIFARSASDAKGPVSMFLAAIDAIDDERLEPNFHMKVIMDFEEELGSPHLPAAVGRYRNALAADMLIIFDGPRHISNQPTLTFGARGISTVTLTVFGPNFPQHSGHYGNYAPNPAVRLSRLIASMKDDYGRVTIPGFYDGINIDDATRAVLRAVPDDERYIQTRIGIAAPDRVAPTYQEALQYPSLNVRGMASGWVGDEKRTIVPATATAEIDIRLVRESDPERLLRLVRAHIEDQGYLVLDRKPTQRERLTNDRICQFEATTSYLAFRTEFDSRVGVWLSDALTRAFGTPPIRLRTSGGSIPISPFVTTLGIPAVTVPTVNRDNNQHSPNENLRIGNYVDGIKTMLAILTQPL
ncbi:MAG: M20/M25/M40 family metallo-hydrolase [Saprospiraceae bacterium]|nr:M20/M25/M40 family metallo-hydrolase [Saprospiraceae bacterium]